MPKAFHDPGYTAPIGSHIMPIRKFQLVADGVMAMETFTLGTPERVTDAQLVRVHTPDYVDAIRTGEPRWLAESQKFPWSPELAASVRLTNGGCIAAADAALRDGVAANIASGFHHAHADHGEGFCTFNGLIVACEQLREFHPNIRVAILDMDLHYGNGTASLATTRPWILALSIYGNDYDRNHPYRDVQVIRHQDGPNSLSRALPNGATKRELMSALEWAFAEITAFKPDLILYQAGADPYKEDPFSPLDLDIPDLMARDTCVFEFCKKSSFPMAWVLAGGYTHDLDKVVQIHLNTFRACAAVWDLK